MSTKRLAYECSQQLPRSGKQPKCPSADEWVNSASLITGEVIVVYPIMKYGLAIKRDGLLIYTKT